jgi:hypothetical protein
MEDAAIPFQNWVAYADFLDPDTIIGPESVFPGFDSTNQVASNHGMQSLQANIKAPRDHPEDGI